MKQYKAVKGPKNIYVDKDGKQVAFDKFTEIINMHTEGGWSYHSMETLSVTESPGCLQKPVTRSYYMLIFEKEI